MMTKKSGATKLHRFFLDLKDLKDFKDFKDFISLEYRWWQISHPGRLRSA